MLRHNYITNFLMLCHEWEIFTGQQGGKHGRSHTQPPHVGRICFVQSILYPKEDQRTPPTGHLQSPPRMGCSQHGNNPLLSN